MSINYAPCFNRTNFVVITSYIELPYYDLKYEFQVVRNTDMEKIATLFVVFYQNKSLKSLYFYSQPPF